VRDLRDRPHGPTAQGFIVGLLLLAKEPILPHGDALCRSALDGAIIAAQLGFSALPVFAEVADSPARSLRRLT
jgi:hypothetical protein